MSLAVDWYPLSRSAADDSASWVNPEPVETGIEIDGKKLYLSLTVSDRRGAGPSREPQNSGSAEMGATPRGSQGVTLEDVKDFGIYAYIRTSIKENQFDMFMQNTQVKGSDFSYSPLKYWPGKDNNLRFMAYMPYKANLNATSEPLAIDVPILDDYTFDTGDTGEEPTYPYVPKLTYTIPNDAADGMDLMTAIPTPSTPTVGNYQSYEYPGDYRKNISFQFHHLLSEVKFKAGDIANGVITAVSLWYVYAKGECSMDETAMRTVDGYGYWFGQDSNDSPSGLEISGDERLIGKPFYMIPQTFANNAELRMTVGFTGEFGSELNTYDFKRSLKDFSTKWEAGKSYSYTLSAPEEVKIEVSDAVEGKVKKNLVIKNTGASEVYVRVALVGSWVKQSTDDASRYDIVGLWNESDGTFSWNGSAPTTTATSGWRKGSDGYYYYMAPVASNSTVPALFNTYTLTAAAPITGASLELNVVAQAVIKRDIADAEGWDADVISTLASQ